MNPEDAVNNSSALSVTEFFRKLFVAGDFMPHGHCYFWRPDVLWLNVVSDAMIAFAYMSIPIILLYFVLKRKDAPFHWIFVMFGLFILLCGITHIIDIYTIWNPVYRLEGIVKFATGVVSLLTAVLLIPVMPKAISIPGLESLVNELSKRTKDLTRTNRELERFNRVTMGREHRILELKKEVNSLCELLNREKPYDLDENER